MLYLHWVTMFPGRWLDEPERAGFLSEFYQFHQFQHLTFRPTLTRHRESGHAFPHCDQGWSQALHVASHTAGCLCKTS